AIETIIGAIRCGNVAAAQWILNRFAPARRGRSFSIEDFPSITGPSDIAPALGAIASSVAAGEMSTDEAHIAARVLERFLTVLETARRLRGGCISSNGSSVDGRP